MKLMILMVWAFTTGAMMYRKPRWFLIPGMLLLIAAVFLTGCSGSMNHLLGDDTKESRTPYSEPDVHAPKVVTGVIVGDPTRTILMDGVETLPLTVMVTVDGQDVPYANPPLIDQASYWTDRGMVTICKATTGKAFNITYTR